jgi:cbb3-type cytochrome oxidase subunit 3
MECHNNGPSLPGIAIAIMLIAVLIYSVPKTHQRAQNDYEERELFLQNEENEKMECLEYRNKPLKNIPSRCVKYFNN